MHCEVKVRHGLHGTQTFIKDEMFPLDIMPHIGASSITCSRWAE